MEQQKARIKDFTDLIVWQKGHELAVSIYEATKKFPREETYSLTDQMRRAASSVTANIAEGFGRQSFKEKLQFYYIARGSLTELKNHLLLAHDVMYLERGDRDVFLSSLEEVQRLLNGLINKSRSFSLSPKLAIFLFFILFSGSYFLISPNHAHALALRMPPSNLGLVGYWNLDDGTSTTATDFSGNGNTGALVGNTVKPTWVTGKFNRGLNLNDTPNAQYVEATTTMNLNSAGTVSVWVNASFLDGTSRNVVNKMNFQTDVNGFALTMRDTAGFGWELADGSSVQASSGGGTLQANTWYHAVLTWNGSNVIIYKNGVQVDSQVQTITPVTTVYPIRIGVDDQAGRQFRGIVDEVRIYNRALSAVEVQSLYGLGLATVKARDNTGLVTYWSFEDATGTKTTDFSGNSITGTLNNFALSTSTSNWANGKRGRALDFDGVDDYVEVADNALLKFGTSNFTLSAWVKTRGAQSTGYGTIIDKGFGGGPGLYYLTVKDSDGSLDFRVTDVNNAGILDTTRGSGFNDGAWHHAVITIDRANNVLRAYQDGAQAGADVDISSILVGVNPTDTFRVGRTSTNTHPFSGLIDDVRVYNRALSAADVLNLYNAGATTANPTIKTVSRRGLVGYWNLDDGTSTKATDFSGNGNTGTLTNSPTWVTGKRGKALSMNGTNFVNMGTASALNVEASPFSVSAWVQITAQPTSTNAFSIITKGQGGGGGAGWAFIYFNDNLSGFIGLDLSKQGVVDQTVAYTLQLNRWYHVAAVQSTGQVEYFVDGASIGTKSNASAYGSSAAKPANIGANNSSVAFMKGSIDEVRVYNRALSAAEILQLYNLGK